MVRNVLSYAAGIAIGAAVGYAIVSAYKANAERHYGGVSGQTDERDPFDLAGARTADETELGLRVEALADGVVLCERTLPHLP